VVKSIYDSQYDNCSKFTHELTTIVRTISFVNSNGWSHIERTIVVSLITVYDLS